MRELFLSDTAKVAILDAVYDAELNYIVALRKNALREAEGKLKEKHILREYRLRDIYKAQYRLCVNLGIGDLYESWRESPTYELSEECGSEQTEQT